MKCLACGVVKDTGVGEFYPYPEDGIVDDEPITPLWVIECQGPVLTRDEAGTATKSDWRVVIVCHHCIHRLDPDLWINDSGWASLNPIMRFDQLPYPIDVDGDPRARFNVEAYADNLI